MLRRKLYHVVLFVSVGILFMIANKQLQRISQTIMSTKRVQREPLPELDMIFVHTADANACAKWHPVHPTSFIVLVGSNAPQNQDDDYCAHVHGIKDALEIMSLAQLAGRPVVVTDDSPSSKACVQRVVQHAAIAASSRYRIVYNNSDTIYNSSRHFGCGGTTDALNSTGSYSFCKRPASLGPVVGVYGEGRVCDNVYPSMSLAPGVHALPKMQCAWVPETSLWMLPFLGGSSGINEVARTMLAEKLLWYSGYRVQVAPHVSSQGSRIGAWNLNLLNDVAAALSEASCHETSPEQCSLDLAAQLSRKGFLHESDIEYLEDWMSTLSGTDHNFSPVIQRSSEQCSNHSLHSHLSEADDSQVHGKNDQQRREIQAKTCPQSGMVHNLAEPWLQYKDILLIVTFNNAEHYDTITYYDVIYRQFFPHILYCGPGDNFTVNNNNVDSTSFSFISYARTPVNKRRGALHYECLIQATGLGYNVKGYLRSSDDIFLNMHRFRHYDVNKAWYYQFNNLDRVHTFEHTFCQRDVCGPDTGNNKFWHQFHNETFDVITEMKSLQTPAVKLCNVNREKHYGGIDWHVRIISDTSYIPTRYIEDVASVLEVFLRNGVYLEIAVPTTIFCIIPHDQFEHIYMDLHNLEHPAETSYSPMVLTPTHPDLVVLSILERRDLFRYNPRTEPYKYVTPQFMQGMSIFHGFKLSYVISQTKTNVGFFCNVMNFFGDPDGNADKHITRYDWPPWEPPTIKPKNQNIDKPKKKNKKKDQAGHEPKTSNGTKQQSHAKNATQTSPNGKKCWHVSPTVIKCAKA